MGKKDKINQIAELLDELYKLGDGKTGSLFIHGDLQEGLSGMMVKGNMQAVATSCGNRMHKDPMFKRVMMSMVGAYLVHHPQDRDDFIASLEISPVSMN